MKACCDARAPTRLNRVGGFFSWVAPGAVLALMPKCPACLAAYIALATGVGVSVPAAENLRVAAVAISVAVLGALASRGVARYWRRQAVLN